ncbi:hypothetical protein LWI28_025923 [Acer negundo]|uniref:RING-type E3 ubiquitin transferase n=1 Tax=Acer negundo TaxID=4023 RepID=A0AAD5NU52_ACENE|nr:hypothetical protein LWI28_025923 [Acer negundo]KAK4849665.1 hypothetical protein QYF36_027096 [Acer negundo]
MDTNISMTLTGHRNNTDNNYVINGKIMLCSVILLFLVVALLVGFHFYGRWHLNHRRRRARRTFLHSSAAAAAANAANTTTTSNNSVTNQALDTSVLKKIPTFVYSSSTTDHDRLLECAVCLSEFEENEKGRVLPKCNHAFHVDCIDMWFQTHSSCPLCRAPVQPATLVQPPVVVSVEDPVSLNEPACSGSEREDAELGRCSSCTLPQSELVSVVVDVPRALDDMGLGLSEASGFKSPGNRVISLKRIWSV